MISSGSLYWCRLTHHKAALKHFYGLLIKQKQRLDNPAELLFTPRKKKSDRNGPLSPAIAFKLLRSMKRNTWLGERNFVIVSMLWALGLRIGELTALKVGSFLTCYSKDLSVYSIFRNSGKFLLFLGV